MKRFAAHFVFPVYEPPFSKGIVETDEAGNILGLVDTKGELMELAGMEFHNGIICPAFVFPENPSWNFYFSRFPFLKKYERLVQGEIPGDRTVLEWMKAVQKEDNLSMELLIRVFTLDSARAVGEHHLGTLEPGKRPGLILIGRIDYPTMKLTEGSRLKRLI